jgi:cytochrome c
MGEKSMKATLALALLAAAATAQAAQAAGDPAMGEQVFKQCLPCHSIGPGAKNKVGPVLNGIDGRHSGSVADFSYSAANKNSGITWDEATFKDYIKDPRTKIPGTKMIFPGIKDAAQADNLWAYLKQFGADGNKK